MIFGLLVYFRDYIANYAELAKPLTDLTLKHIPQIIPWGEQEQGSFQCLKDKLCDASALAIPRPGDPVTVVVDTSSISIVACALHADSEGRERPTAYLSQKLTKAQTKWSTIESEAFTVTVICALRKWYAFVFGAPICRIHAGGYSVLLFAVLFGGV